MNLNRALLHADTDQIAVFIMASRLEDRSLAVAAAQSRMKKRAFTAEEHAALQNLSPEARFRFVRSNTHFLVHVKRLNTLTIYIAVSSCPG